MQTVRLLWAAGIPAILLTCVVAYCDAKSCRRDGFCRVHTLNGKPYTPHQPKRIQKLEKSPRNTYCGQTEHPECHYTPTSLHTLPLPPHPHIHFLSATKGKKFWSVRTNCVLLLQKLIRRRSFVLSATGLGEILLVVHSLGCNPTQANRGWSVICVERGGRGTICKQPRGVIYSIQ